MALRVAVAGLGPRGLEWCRHLATAGVASCVGAVDLEPSARARARAEPALSGVPVEADLPALAAATRPDALIVATTPSSHADVVAQGLELGWPVLVEKPFTVDLASAVRLVRLAEARALPLLVAQNYRFMRAHRTVRQVVDQGTLGRLTDITCHYWRPSHVANAGLEALDAVVLWETAVHHLDVMLHVLRRRVVGVCADVSSAPWATTLRGTSARVLLEFEGGVRGQYSVSWHARGHEFFEAGQQFYERLAGEHGTLHVLQRWLVLCLAGRWPRFVPRGPRAEHEEVTLLRALAAACAGDHDQACAARDNLQTIATLEACRVSWTTRRWVDPQSLLREVEVAP